MLVSCVGFVVDSHVLFVFFFFKQKTAYEMRISDWSSDVCSSDLPTSVKAQELDDRECIRGKQAGKLQCCLQSRLLVEAPEPEFLREPLPTLDDFEVVLRPQYSDRVPGIGISAATPPTASDAYLRLLERKTVWMGKRGSRRVD